MEWSATHEYAFATRDPNTCTYLLWRYGLHNRPWSERPLFGTTRYMRLDGMRCKKTDVGAYIREVMQSRPV